MSTEITQPHPRVASVQVGRIAPLGPDGVPSGFVKTPVIGRVDVGRLGLGGDEQADLTVHGGTDKAVYCYPLEHYAEWAGDAPGHAGSLVPGGFGENLTIAGLSEEGVSIGDVFGIGTAEVQVTQPRQPCFKLVLRFGDNTLGRVMMRTGRTGWYVRVLKAGWLQAGDRVEVLNRIHPEWTIARFNQFLLRGRDDRKTLEELAALDALAEVWRDAIRAALGR